MSALTRSGVIPLYRIVNGGPAKCYSLPDIDRHGDSARGAGLRDDAILLRHFVFGHSRSCGSIGVFCVRFTPAVCRMSAKQDGLRYVPFLFRHGSRSPFVCSRIDGAVIGLGWFTSGLCVFWRRSRQRNEGTRERSRRRGVGALLREHIGLAMFSAGSPLGLRAPNLRQGVIDSLDSLHVGRGVGAFHAARSARI